MSKDGSFILKPSDADQLGAQLSALVASGRVEEARQFLAPVLAQRTPFPILERIGRALGATDAVAIGVLLDRIADDRTEGGWVVIAGALGRQLSIGPERALERCRLFIVSADIWYAADIFGDRVPGPFLLDNFEGCLRLLSPWREDPNAWVRRTVGIAAHFWAKRSRGEKSSIPQARALLAFLEPLFSERDLNAAKGIGYGLKTLGKFYPGLLSQWLPAQLRRPHRSLMLLKALTYLSPAQRAVATKGLGR